MTYHTHLLQLQATAGVLYECVTCGEKNIRIWS